MMADLTERIEGTRIRYIQLDHGVRIEGAAFICEFDTAVEPEAFCEEICSAEDPWQMFGLKHQLAEDYWKVVGNLFHVEDGKLTGSSKIALEVSPEWARVYFKEDASAERFAEFVRALDSAYGVEVSFVEVADGCSGGARE